MSDTEQSEKRKLRPAQVTASTLAATTGAFLAAQLGVYGTVVGVGVMSLLSTIGTELYSRSLERGKSAARLASRARPGGQHPNGSGQHPDGSRPAAGAAGAPDTAAGGDDAPGPREPAESTAPGPQESAESTAPGQEHVASTTDAESGPRRLGGRLRWPVVIAGSAVTFLLTMIIITGIETMSGSTLSGAEGSTVSNVVTGDTGSDERGPDEEPDDRAPAPTDDPTAPGDEPEQGTEPDEPESTTGDDDGRDENDPETSEPEPEDETVSPDEETTPPAEDPREREETPGTGQ